MSPLLAWSFHRMKRAALVAAVLIVLVGGNNAASAFCPFAANTGGVNKAALTGNPTARRVKTPPFTTRHPNSHLKHSPDDNMKGSVANETSPRPRFALPSQGVLASTLRAARKQEAPPAQHAVPGPQVVQRRPVVQQQQALQPAVQPPFGAAPIQQKVPVPPTRPETGTDVSHLQQRVTETVKALEAERDARDKDRDLAAHQIRALGTQGAAKDEDKRQLELHMRSELQAKDDFYRSMMAALEATKVKEMLQVQGQVDQVANALKAVQSRLETSERMVNNPSVYGERAPSIGATAGGEKNALMQEIASLRLALQEQEKAASMQGGVAELAQLRKEYAEVVKELEVARLAARGQQGQNNSAPTEQQQQPKQDGDNDWYTKRW